jgi:hypothetical protein
MSTETVLPAEVLDPFGYATHEVLNQPPPLADYDAFGTDEVLKTIVRTFDAEIWGRAFTKLDESLARPACKSWPGKPTEAFPSSVRMTGSASV